MAVSRQSSVLLGFVAVVSIGLALSFWLNRGYGEVSPETYEYSKALYSACLNKNKEHLDKVEALLVSSENVPQNERNWLESIIERARGEHWKSASNDARRMMEDQVKH